MFYLKKYFKITHISIYVTFGRALGLQHHRIAMFYEVCAWDRINTLCFTRSALGTVSKRYVLRGLCLGPYQNVTCYDKIYSEITKVTTYVTFEWVFGLQNMGIAMIYEVCAWNRIKTLLFTRYALGTVSERCVLGQILRSHPNHYTCNVWESFVPPKFPDISLDIDGFVEKLGRRLHTVDFGSQGRAQAPREQRIRSTRRGCPRSSTIA